MAAKLKVYSEDEAKARLAARAAALVPRGRLDPAPLPDQQLEGHADGDQRGGPSGRGRVAPSGPHRVLCLGRGPADDPRPQGHDRQGLRAGEEDRGGGAVAARPRRRCARRHARRTICASPTSSTTRPRPEPARGLPGSCRPGLGSRRARAGGKRVGRAGDGVPGGGLPVLLAGLRRSRDRGQGRRRAAAGRARPARSRREGSAARRPRPEPLVGGRAGDHRGRGRARGRAAARQRPAAVRRASAPTSRGCARCWRWPSGPAASSIMPARAACSPTSAPCRTAAR